MCVFWLKEVIQREGDSGGVTAAAPPANSICLCLCLCLYRVNAR